mmetsp:Transcript_33479/g.86527  ORF Transcript_33479/g.86527 Transcript_33479/m.86527 type:complete len:501 (-) Transcript_33479:95-1597(-)
MNPVKLVASPLGGMGGLAGYHTSVLVSGEEYSFSNGGISVGRGPESHNAPGLQGFQSFELGATSKTGSQLLSVMRPHFMPGTYDLLRKSCNYFSDTAIFYLLGQRLDSRYSSLERMGAGAGGFVQLASAGQYTPNPLADGFNVQSVISGLGVDHAPQAMAGQVVGGTAARSAEEVQAARLAHLSTPGFGALPPVSRVDPLLPSPPSMPGADLREQALRDEELARRLQAEEEPFRTPVISGRAAGMPPINPLGNVVRGMSQMFNEIVFEIGQLQQQPGQPQQSRSANPGQPPAEMDRQLGQGLPAGAQRRASGPPAVNPLPVNPLDGLFRGVSGMLNEIVSEVSQLQQQHQHQQPQQARGRPASGPGQADDFGPHMNRQFSGIVGDLESFGRAAAMNFGPAMEEFERQMGHMFEGAGGSGGGLQTSDLDARTAVVTYSGPTRGVAAEIGQCSVCLEGFVQGEQLRIMPCFHTFHKDCIDRWLGNSQECPVCKYNIMRPQQG